MAKLSASPAVSSLIKLIFIGYSGLGKSSAIIPLSIPDLLPSFPGLELRVADFDGKFEEVAREQLRYRLDKKKISQTQHDAALDNIDVCVCRDNLKVTTVNGEKKIGVIGQPMGWKNCIKQIDQWSQTLSANTILVVDSFSHLATIAVPNYTQAMSNKLNQPLSWQDYLPAQQLVQNFLTLVADLPCHVILTAHQEPLEIYKKTGKQITKPNGSVEDEEELIESMMAPISIGNKGRTKIPAQLNHMLVAAASPSGERRIYTQPEDGVTPKTPFFNRVDKFYTIEDGLVKYWMLG